MAQAKIALACGAVLAVAGSVQAAEPARTPSFTKDVAPIFQAKCEACHRTNSIAPMALTTFEESRPWARSIRTRVASRQMPPWHIDKTVGIQHFQNDRSLTDEQIDTIVRWVDGGAPKGDPKDMPPPVKWPEEQGWNFAAAFGQTEPDLIIRSPQWTQHARGQDAWYKPLVETGITEPRWVRAIEIRPGSVKGRKITHHALARLQQDDPDAPPAPRRQDDDNPPDPNAPLDDNVGPGLLMEWAVGKQGEIMRPNSGKLLLPGAKIRWDIHYSSAGEEVTDHVELGLYFYPKGQEPKYRQVLASFGAARGVGLDIRPNSIAVNQGFHVMRKAGRVENFQPHMHLRGKAMMMEAILPNGQTQWVGNGDRTVDEMAHAWVNITYMDDEDFKAEVEKRKATETRTTQQQQQQQ